MDGWRLLLWGGVALGVLIPVACFACASRPVALRSQSIGRGAVAALCGYLVLLILAPHSFRGAELVLFYFLLLPSLLLLARREWWVVRAGSAAVEERIASGCAGLLISSTPLPGQGVRLSMRAGEVDVRWLALGKGVTLLDVPRHERGGKVRLLINWLAKQYPEPRPRLRIRLK